MRDLPPLSCIRAFEAAARHENFTRAAEELKMTQAAVSYHVKVLEDRVRGPLFLRRGRQIKLSPSGRKFAASVGQALDSLSVAFNESRQASESVLSIQAPPTLGVKWLAPRLGEFQAKHPALTVKLGANSGQFAELDEDVDVAIVGGDGRFSQCDADLLLQIKVTAMASRCLLERTGVKTPHDLVKLPLIGRSDHWEAWFRAAGVEDPKLSLYGSMQLATHQLASAVARTGAAAALLVPEFFQDELARGELVRPFDFDVEVDRAYWLVYRRGQGRLRKVAAFRKWIQSLL